jgi:cathepsin X
MTQFVVLLLALAILGLTFSFEEKQPYRNELDLVGDDIIGEVVRSRRPSFAKEDLPENWDYRTQGLLTSDLNQHIPTYCGSCWAHAALSSIADRIKIATKGAQRDVLPSIQALINCGNAGTCNGGDSNAANAWIYKNGGIPDVTCQQYQAKNMECTAENTCMNCSPSGGCVAVTDFPNITISEHGSVKGDTDIMSEIYARGPVSAYINANCIEDYTGNL